MGRRTSIRHDRNPGAFPYRHVSRDTEIFRDIQFIGGGVMAVRQVHERHFPGRAQRTLADRLGKLYHNGFINWPSKEERGWFAIPEPIVWLDYNAARLLASLEGIEVALPGRVNENQIRKLQLDLRNKGFHWSPMPRWSTLRHDLAVIDAYMVFERSLRRHPNLKIATWQTDTNFRRNPDFVEYSQTSKQGEAQTVRKGIIPDAYMEIQGGLSAKGEPYTSRLVIEVDYGSIAVESSWGKGKARPYAEWIASEAYKVRYGHNKGRILVLVKGDQRLQHLKTEAERVLNKAAYLFWFTSLERALSCDDILFNRIWLRGNWDHVGSLFASMG